MRDIDDFSILTSLSEADAAELDAMLEAGAQHKALLSLADDKPHGNGDEATTQVASQGSGQRACRIAQLMGLIGSCPVEDASVDLVEQTLARLADARQRQRFTQQVQALGGGSGPSVYWWRELATVAAVLMIGFSLLWPVMERVRADARRVACANNLAAVGSAMGRYAADYGNTMPRRKVSPGTAWWRVGQVSDADESVQSNSAHLYVLVRRRYIAAPTLGCPGNTHAATHLDHHNHDWPRAQAVSFSYQNQHASKPIRLNELPEMAILADKNPLFGAAVNGRAEMAYHAGMDPDSPTVFHGSRGQNILTSFGRVIWRAKPQGPNGDNIWLIRGVHDYQGVEVPRDAGDSFLVP